MKKDYTKALIESILAGTPIEKALSSLKSLLKRRGHERLLAQILRATLRELVVAERQVAASVSVAAADTVANETIAKALVTLGATDSTSYRTTVDKTLVGGFTARVGGMLLDKSYKRSLINLYRTITK